MAVGVLNERDGDNMTDNVQDIAVSDNYGRAKRASLLYGAGLIVLAVATPTGHSVSVLGAAVPLDVARFLTWLAVSYYSAAFLLEWRVARITNSKAITSDAGSSVLKRFDELAETFKRYNERIAVTSSGYVQALVGLKGNIEQIAQSMPNSINRLDERDLHEGSQGYSEFLRTTEAINTQLSNFKMTVDTDRNIVAARAQDNLDAYAAINKPLTELATDFRTLAGRFNYEQRIIFYVFDLGAVGLMFFAATGIAILATLHIIGACIA
jgi:hypothetical protein